MEKIDCSPLDLIVIYDHPIDYPKNYVARIFKLDKQQQCMRPSNEFYLSDNLEELRDMIPFGKVRLERDFKDDPVIVESWF